MTFFDGGNIILGGDGSDIIEGRGGNDLIDGDAWLNVRISVRANADGTGAEIATLRQHGADGPAHAGRHLQSRPAARSCARSCTRDGPDFDTAVFSGQPGRLHDRHRQSGHRQPLDDIVTVTDNVGTDGIDTLKHIERLQFADQAIVLGGLNNAAGRAR